MNYLPRGSGDPLVPTLGTGDCAGIPAITIMSVVTVRTVGPDGAASVSTSEITLQRPRSTIRKSFQLPVVPSSSNAECYAAAVGPQLKTAVQEGRSLFVFAAGAAGSGKTCTLRGCQGEDGVMALACEQLFE